MDAVLIAGCSVAVNTSILRVCAQVSVDASSHLPFIAIALLGAHVAARKLVCSAAAAPIVAALARPTHCLTGGRAA